jgi:hypothetical protein
VIVLAILSIVNWKWWHIKKVQPQKPVATEYKDPKSGNADIYSQWQTYENKKYNFQMKYPADRHIFSDDGETEFSDQDLGNGQTVKQGGSVFFSNKDIRPVPK